MNSENLGELIFSFRGALNAWRSDLQEADRIQQEYRAKWEKPVNMAVAAAAGEFRGGSGGGSEGFAGPNIGGTSNGDVTWRGQGGSFGSSGRWMRMWGGGGGSRGGSKRAQFEEMGMDYDEMREMKRQADYDARVNRVRAAQAKQNEIDLLRMRQRQDEAAASEFDRLRAGDERQAAGARRSLNQELSHADDGDLRSIINPETGEFIRTAGQARPAWYQKSVPIRNLLRFTMAGLVVDAIATELGSEENYKKAARLAGLDQGAQATATVGRFKDAVGGLPLIGPLLSNLFSPLTTPIETSIQLGAMQQQYQNQMVGVRMGILGTNTQAAQAMASPLGLVRSALGISQQREQARAEAATKLDDLRKNAGYETDDPVTLGTIFWGNPLPSAVRRRIQGAEDAQRLRNDARSAQINGIGKSMNAADDALTASQQQALNWKGQYDVSMSAAALQRSHWANQWKPTQGVAIGTVMEAQATSDYMDRPAPAGYSATADRSKLSPEGKAYRDEQSLLRNNLLQMREGLQSQFNDLNTNYLMGSGREYNPAAQSAVGFTDRSPETVGDKMEALTKAINELTAIISKTSH